MRLTRTTLHELEGGRRPTTQEVDAMVTELLTLRDAEERDGTVPVWVEHPSFKPYRTKLLPAALNVGARVTMGGRIFTVAKVLEPTEPNGLRHVIFR